jgi:hypothetical protein
VGAGVETGAGEGLDVGAVGTVGVAGAVGVAAPRAGAAVPPEAGRTVVAAASAGTSADVVAGAGVAAALGGAAVPRTSVLLEGTPVGVTPGVMVPAPTAVTVISTALIEARTAAPADLQASDDRT